MNSKKKFAKLKTALQALQPGVIAVSGGLDSRFLSTMACCWGLDFHTVFFTGPQLSPKEVQTTQNFLQALDLPFHILQTDPLSLSMLLDNPPQRCYFCKKYLFSQARTFFVAKNRPILVDGTNASDSGQHRPGLKALQELGVHSPLALAGLDKEEIRNLARERGLSNPEQPARPCLMTRFAYGQRISHALLKSIGELEDLLLELGFSDLRLRKTSKTNYILQLLPQDKILWKAKKELIRQAARGHGINKLIPCFEQELSGFHDRKQTSSPKPGRNR